MAISAESSMLPSSERRRCVRQVVGEVVLRIVQGEEVNDQAVLAQHPELLPDLVDELRKAQSDRDGAV